MEKQDGWTKTPNKIYEVMAGMCEAELRVTMVVCRMTYGFRRDAVELQYEDFMIHGGLQSRASIAKGVKLMLRRGFFAKGNGRSEYIIAGAKSSPNELNEDDKSSLNKLLPEETDTKSSLNEPLKSSLNEPFQSNKEIKKEEEKNPFPYQPPPKEDLPEHKSPADRRVDAVLEVCGLDRTIPQHLRQAENVAAQLSKYTAEDIYGRYRPGDSSTEWNWYTDDWRGQRGDMPSPAQVVDHIAKTRTAASRPGDNGRHPSPQTAGDRIRAQIAAQQAAEMENAEHG